MFSVRGCGYDNYCYNERRSFCYARRWRLSHRIKQLDMRVNAFLRAFASPRQRGRRYLTTKKGRRGLGRIGAGARRRLSALTAACYQPSLRICEKAPMACALADACARSLCSLSARGTSRITARLTRASCDSCVDDQSASNNGMGLGRRQWNEQRIWQHEAYRVTSDQVLSYLLGIVCAQHFRGTRVRRTPLREIAATAAASSPAGGVRRAAFSVKMGWFRVCESANDAAPAAQACATAFALLSCVIASDRHQ